MKKETLIMLSLLIGPSLIVGIGFTMGSCVNYPNYRVGDCLRLRNGQYTHKVLAKGTYGGIKAIHPLYGGFEETIFSEEELNGSHRMDCFNLFDSYSREEKTQ
jgi:hypothetical protein